MTATRWRALVVALLMCFTSALAYVARPTLHLADKIGQPNLETAFPKEFADWRIDTNMPVVLPSPDAQAVLNAIYNQVLARTYVNSAGQRIMLSVAYGGDQSDGTRAHRPEVCYPAQGFQIVYNERSTVKAADREVAARVLMSKLGGRSEPITYWVVVGGEVATSGTEQKLAQMRYGLRGVIPDGLLVRVSSIDSDMARGLTVQARFIDDLAKSVGPDVRSRFFGGPLL